MADNRFTSTALGAIRLAQENAARLGHSYVGSEHLLLGLASQEYSMASRLLRTARPSGRPSPSWWAPGSPTAPCTRG